MLNNKNIKHIIALLIIGGISLILASAYIEYRYQVSEKNQIKLTKINNDYKSFFNESGKPKDEITIKEIQNLKKETKNIKINKEEKEKILTDLNNLENYLQLKEEISSYYNKSAMLSNVKEETINKLKSKNKNINKNYQIYINDYIKDLEEQRLNIDNENDKIDSLFSNSEKTELKENVTKETIEAIRLTLNKLPQEDVKSDGNAVLDKAINIINEKEESIRKQKEEEARKQQEAINNAWVRLNVPYISQNNNQVYNGCEAASLLMALQYKNYLTNMTITQYATDMPKSENNNAQEGFTHDIFGYDPRDIPHWIAPEPLAKFGRDSSGNQNVINITGATIDDLDRELDNGNPVVIYLTAMFETPKAWVEGAPQNIHVQLLTGYNKITQEHIIVDPWTYPSGRTSWTVSRQTVENLYNALGKQSVVIR